LAEPCVRGLGISQSTCKRSSEIHQNPFKKSEAGVSQMVMQSTLPASL